MSINIPLNFNKNAVIHYQKWELGKLVTVGFMNNLKIIAIDNGQYTLQSIKGIKYLFIPYMGIERIS